MFNHMYSISELPLFGYVDGLIVGELIRFLWEF